MRLIDADALKKELDEWALCITGEHEGKSYDRGCVNFIIDYMSADFTAYCPNCGQKLDWSEDDKAEKE